MKSKYPEIRIYHELRSLELCQGETITIYAHKPYRYSNDMQHSKKEQIEIRINKDKIEIFCSQDEMQIELKSFDKWKEFEGDMADV